MEVDDVDVPMSPRITSSTCIICANPITLQFDEDGSRIQVKEEVNTEDYDEPHHNEREASFPSSADEETIIVGEVNFNWELKLFNFFYNYLKLGGIKMTPYDTWKLQWNLKYEPVPICDPCKIHLRSVQRDYEELKRLQKIVSEEMKKVKQKLVGSEWRFKKDENELYNRDERYYWSRCKLIGHRVVGQAYDVLKSHQGKKPVKSSKGKAPLTKVVKAIDKDAKGEKKVTRSSGKMNVTKQNEDEKFAAPKSESEGITGGDFIGHTVGMEDEEEDRNNSFDFVSPGCEDDSKDHVWEDEGPSSVSGLDMAPPSSGSTSVAGNNFQSEEELEQTDEPGRKRSRRSAGKRIFYKDDVDNWDSDLDIEKPPPPVPPKPRPPRKMPPPKTQDDYDEDFDFDECQKTAKILKRIRSEPEKRCWKKFKPVFEEDRGQYRYLMTYFDKTGENQYQCNQCKSIVKGGLNVMKVHANVEHLTNQCPWPYCNFVGKNKHTTEKHFMTTHDEIQNKKYLCDICGFPATTSSRIKYHKLTHLNAEERKAYEESNLVPSYMSKAPCEKCGKIIRKINLSRHLQICGNPDTPNTIINSKESDSEEEKAYLCAQCGKSMKTPAQLNKHVRLEHPDPNTWGSMPFACVFPGCDKRFTRENDLKVHKTQHEVYAFHCALCPRKFARKRAYDTHLLLHTTERKFQCHACEMGFTYKHCLKRHIENYHEEGSNPKRASFYKDPSRGRFHQTKAPRTSKKKD